LTRNENDENRSVALYWDFENLHAGLAEAKYGEGSYSKPDATTRCPAARNGGTMCRDR